MFSAGSLHLVYRVAVLLILAANLTSLASAIYSNAATPSPPIASIVLIYVRSAVLTVWCLFAATHPNLRSLVDMRCFGPTRLFASLLLVASAALNLAAAIALLATASYLSSNSAHVASGVCVLVGAALFLLAATLQLTAPALFACGVGLRSARACQATALLAATLGALTVLAGEIVALAVAVSFTAIAISCLAVVAVALALAAICLFWVFAINSIVLARRGTPPPWAAPEPQPDAVAIDTHCPRALAIEIGDDAEAA